MTALSSRPAAHPGSSARRPFFSTTYLRIELTRLARNRRTVVFTVAMPVLMFLAIGGPQLHRGSDGARLAAAMLISIGVWAVMVATTSVASSVAIERAQGWNRQLRLTPLPPTGYVLIKVATATAFGLVALIATVATGLAAGISLPLGTWLASGAIALATSAVFSALGLLLGFALPTQNVMQFIGPILALLALAGGLFVPVSAMPAALQVVARLTPAWGVGELARAPLAGGPFPWLALASAAAWLVIFGALAAWRFRKDTARS